jgi:hypothetical protein
LVYDTSINATCIWNGAAWVIEGNNINIGYISVNDYGAVGDGVTDDTTAILAAIAAATARTNTQVLFPSASYKVTSTLNILCTSNVRLVGNGSILDFSSASAAVTAILFYGIGNGAPYYQINTGMTGIMLNGPGRFTASVGLDHSGTGTLGASHITHDRCNIYNFGTGTKIGDNAYLITYDHCDIHSNNDGVYLPSGLIDSGENIKFVSCCIFNNSRYGVNHELVNATLNLIATSLDYNDISIRIVTGRINLVACNIENNTGVHIVQPAGNLIPAIISAQGTAFISNLLSGVGPNIDIAGLASFTMSGGDVYTEKGAGTTLIRGNSNASIILDNVDSMFNFGATFFNPNGCTYVVKSKYYNNGMLTTSNIRSDNGQFYNGNKFVTLTVLNAWTSLAIGTNAGLFAFRDSTSGGMAVYAIDSTMGAPVAIFNTITGFEAKFDAGTVQMVIRVTAGVVPRNINWAQLMTNV